MKCIVTINNPYHKMTPQADLAFVTYNAIPKESIPRCFIEDDKTLILDSTFTPKKPENVLPSDKNWALLMKHKASLRKVIIFVGKKSSGSLEIIHLACTSFKDKKECLFFVMCDHDLMEKVELLETYSIPRDQYMIFSDGHLPCQELPVMWGYGVYYFQMNRMAA